MVKGSIFAVLSAILYGLMPLFVKRLIAEGISCDTIVFYRFFISVILVGIFIVLRKNKKSMTLSKSNYKVLFTSAVFGMLPTSFLLYYSYNFIESGLATVIHFTYPVIVIIAMALFLKRKIYFYHHIAIVLSLIGMGIISLRGDINISIYGIIIALLSGVTYSLYIILIGENTKKIDSIVLTFYVSLFASIGMFIYGSLFNTLNLRVDLYSFGLLLGLSIFCNIFTVYLFSLSMRYINPQEASLFSMFEPLTGVIMGILVFDESIMFMKILGCSLIVLSVVVLSYFMYRKERIAKKRRVAV